MNKTDEYKNKFQKENYERINIFVPCGKKQELKEYANCNDISLNGLILRALEEKTFIDLKTKTQK